MTQKKQQLKPLFKSFKPNKDLLGKTLIVLIVLILICFFVTASALAISGKIPTYGLPSDETVTLEVLVITLGFLLVLSALISLPAIMVTTYRTVGMDWLEKKIEEDLFLCGITNETDLKDQLIEFKSRNNFLTFFWPTAILTILLLVLWGLTFAPHGLTGLSASLTQGRPSGSGFYTLNSQLFFNYMAENATIITWAFLGAYFYIMTILASRWYRLDLTTGLLWKANMRLVIVMVVGLLLIKAWPDVPAFVAFLTGIIPDRVLGWMADAVKNTIALFKEDTIGLFKRRDLEVDIKGISFWQAERLVEEGIESVQNLATKEIPSLLINTRFETPTILYWIDQALLINQVGADNKNSFNNAFIETATDLFDIKENKARQNLGSIVKSIADGQVQMEDDKKKLTITKPMLENLVKSLEQGPNLCYLRNYWNNVRDPGMLQEKKGELRSLNM